ncbi:SGNH/GDSL hydrolase family protein [Fulvivirgaceae bacterium BMA12]|uniref:SGNH/GDSL hydrolase family protein n=1 Tax=Agaribacillus aureus TaxID=3051825 RepID=A0ABT8L9N9_9BACT|nr:SGNH/GDSL hydrolase family protein [Fulvivirgaceae bacterium BMA12]
MMKRITLKFYFTFFLLLMVLISCEKKTVPEAAILVNKRVLFLGNSITNQGGYVSYIEYYLRKQFPADRIDIISIGLSSETVSCLSELAHPFPRPCLRERLERALQKIKPDIVVACYGMNDGIYHPQSPDRMERFREGIHHLLQQINGVGAKAILMSPPVFDPLPLAERVVDDGATDFSYLHPYENYDSVLGDYSEWLQSLNDADIRVIDVHGPMKAQIMTLRSQNPSFSYSTDGIHPSASGHLFIAQQFLKSFGYTFDQDIKTLADSVESDNLFQLVDARRKLRSEGWLKFVGYIRKDTVKQDHIDDIEMEVARLDREISTKK